MFEENEARRRGKEQRADGEGLGKPHPLQATTSSYVKSFPLAQMASGFGAAQEPGHFLLATSVRFGPVPPVYSRPQGPGRSPEEGAPGKLHAQHKWGTRARLCTSRA